MRNRGIRFALRGETKPDRSKASVTLYSRRPWRRTWVCRDALHGETKPDGSQAAVTLYSRRPWRRTWVCVEMPSLANRNPTEAAASVSVFSRRPWRRTWVRRDALRGKTKPDRSSRFCHAFQTLIFLQVFLTPLNKLPHLIYYLVLESNEKAIEACFLESICLSYPVHLPFFL